MDETPVIRNLAEWSAAVRLRDGCCTKCGETSNLHAHHIKRKSQFPELALDLNNGATLCNECHAKEHESDFPALAGILASNDFTARSKGPKKRKKPVESVPQYADSEIMQIPRPSSVPSAKLHIPKPELARALIAAIGRSQRWVAERIGISERRLRYLLAGTRDVEGKQVAVTMTYPEQFALEALVSAAQAMRQD